LNHPFGRFANLPFGGLLSLPSGGQQVLNFSFSLYLERHIMEKFLTRLQQQAEEEHKEAYVTGGICLSFATKTTHIMKQHS